MLFPGAKIVIACSFLVHFAWINTANFIMESSSFEVFMFIASVQSLTYICYPLLGWLADTRFIRYSVIRFSIVVLLLLSILQGIGMTTVLVVNYIDSSVLQTYSLIALAETAVPIAVGIITMGMFEANAIQFGMYQMLEANSDQLVTFIHWYYWSIQLSRGLMILVSMGVDLMLRSCWFDIHVRTRADAQLLPGAPIVLTISLIQGIMAAVGVFILQHYKRHLNIDHVGHSPFTMLYKIVKYAWQHKCPVHSPTGRMTFLLALILAKTNMEDLSLMNKLRTLRPSFAYFYYSCLSLASIYQTMATQQYHSSHTAGCVHQQSPSSH